MAVVTIRNIDESHMAKLKVLAARNGRSMEEEARQLIVQGLRDAAAQPGLGSRMAQRVAGLGGLVLPVSSRLPGRLPPNFGDEYPTARRKARASKPVTGTAAPSRKR